MKAGLLLFVFLFSSYTFAGYVGTVSTATAGSGRADIDPPESIMVNPAALSRVKGYFFSTSYSTAQQPTGNGNDFVISISDNTKDSALPAAFHYVQSYWGSLLGDRRSKDFQLSFGNMVSRNISTGLSIRMRDDQWQEKSYRQWTGNLGAIWSFNKRINFAAVAENFYPVASAIPKSVRLPYRIGLGMTYRFPQFALIKLDLVSATNQSFSQPEAIAGVEYLFNRWVIFRLGTGFNWENDSETMAAGIGFGGPKFKLNYAFHNQEDLNRHSVDLVVPIW